METEDLRSVRHIKPVTLYSSGRWRDASSTEYHPYLLRVGITGREATDVGFPVLFHLGHGIALKGLLE